MRVRFSKGLRVGAAMVGMCLAGVGCQSRGLIAGLHDGPVPRTIMSSSGPILPTESGETVQVVEPSGPTPGGGRVIAPEQPSSRPIFHRLMRPVGVRETTSPSAPVEVQVRRPAIASNWAPVQRDGQANEPTLTAAGFQAPDKGKPAAPLPMPPGILAPSLEPPVKVKPGVTPPPSLDPPSRVRPEPEPLQLHTPRAMPGEPATDQPSEAMPPVEFGHPGFVPKAPHELSKQSLPAYIIEPPDILLIDTTAAPEDIQSVRGQHLVRPDGTIGLGVFGSVYVNGMTLDQAREAVAQAITRGLDPEKLKQNPKLAPKASDISLDVYAYNSKVFYVITDGAGFGEQVRRFPVTGNETVLDAISLIDGLPSVASKKKIFIARRTHGDGPPKVLPVDWIGITQGALAATNYQVMPGDRIYVHSQGIIRADSAIGKVLAPIERLLGTTLLGSSTVNSIRNRGQFSGTGLR